MKEHRYYVYIVASKSRVIYIGVTGNLTRRVCQHRLGRFEGFSKTYRCNRLVWFEVYMDVQVAIAREKQMKRWNRSKKVFLIDRDNPTWEDLGGEG